jgi:hypothetical protein
MFSVCVYVRVFLCLCTGRGLTTSWSPVQGVLPAVPDQETEETQPYAPKSGSKLPSVGATRKKKIHTNSNSNGRNSPCFLSRITVVGIGYVKGVKYRRVPNVWIIHPGSYDTALHFRTGNSALGPQFLNPLRYTDRQGNSGFPSYYEFRICLTFNSRNNNLHTVYVYT